MIPNTDKIQGETRCIGKPRDWDDALDGPCGALSVRDEIDVQSGVNFMHSEWKFQPGERELINNHNGVLVLRISGAVHPVVSLHAEARKADDDRTVWFEKPNAALAFCIAVEAIRNAHDGNSIEILCDNPEADSLDQQTAVEVTADFTNWKPQRFYGVTPLEAILAAGVEQARRR